MSKKQILLAGLLSVGMLTYPFSAFAGTVKSPSFRVKVVVEPRLEIVSPALPESIRLAQNEVSHGWQAPAREELGLQRSGNLVSVKTNLGRDYIFQESLKQTKAGQTVKTFSVTAL